MAELVLSFGYIIGLAIDILVLYFVASALKVRGNSIGKAVVLALVSAFLGYFFGPLLLAAFLVSLTSFLAATLMSVFFRLLLIKLVYRVGLGKALSIWVASAIVSIAASLFLPFY